MSDKVSEKHPLYDILYEKRQVFKDVLSGVDALVDDAEEYLPQLPAETDDSYEDRKTEATLNNYAKKAVKVMAGMVFQKPIELGDDVPEQIVAISENVDKEGNHLDIFARRGFELGFEGYGVIVVDKPSIVVEDAKTQADLDLSPYARFYDADSIWNWQYRTNPVSQALELSLLVLKECTQEPVGRFGVADVVRYRVYYLDAIGNVWLEVWIEQDDDEVLEQEPKMLALSAIPAPVIGKLGNECPLYDIAKKNVEHFRTYSAYKSIIYKSTVPQRVLEGGSPDDIAPIGADITLFPPQGCKAYMIEIEGKGVEKVEVCLQNIADDIALMTNSILADKADTQKATATGELIDNAAETSELRVMATAYKDTLERMFGFMAEFLNLGTDAGGSLELGTQWAAVQTTVQPDEVRVWSDLVDRGQMSLETFLGLLVSAGELSIEVKDELGRISTEMKENAKLAPPPAKGIINNGSVQ
jgi:hypothetical protein